MAWVSEVVATYGPQPPVLEVGSQIVNGSVRSLFGEPYVGVDFCEGPGVDHVVKSGFDLSTLGTFNTIVSTEALEHDPRPHVTFKRISAALNAGGLLIATMRGFSQGDDRHFPYHGFPNDYWRYSPDAVRVLCADAQLDVMQCDVDPEFPGLFVLARKP